MKIRTHHIEWIAVSIILWSVWFLTDLTLIGWVTTLAVLFTFNYMQVADRLAERETIHPIRTVECVNKLQSYWFSKEICWIVVFMMIHNYPALVGCGLFITYPVWRKLYRFYKPLQIIETVVSPPILSDTRWNGHHIWCNLDPNLPAESCRQCHGFWAAYPYQQGEEDALQKRHFPKAINHTDR